VTGILHGGWYSVMSLLPQYSFLLLRRLRLKKSESLPSAAGWRNGRKRRRRRNMAISYEGRKSVKSRSQRAPRGIWYCAGCGGIQAAAPAAKEGQPGRASISRHLARQYRIFFLEDDMTTEGGIGMVPKRRWWNKKIRYLSMAKRAWRQKRR